LEPSFKAHVVRLIANGSAEEALQILAEHYGVSLPKLKVGLPKGHKRNSLGCYTPRNRTISVLDSEALRAPFIVLHEFYHHLRTNTDLEHKGTEKNANEFAKDFIHVYKLMVPKDFGK
jgi:hypothetical protein